MLDCEHGPIRASVSTHLEMVPCSNLPSLSPTPNHSIEMNGYSSFSQYLQTARVVVGGGERGGSD